ncbi:uncharacterized protein LOC114758106 [Neltuma alba]|uniref:uncharacterized protein LOC114758106 n=1 Tax=Neltuma alba TaxID=207710 RepID=UPI0010A473BB|nr:uncharacterized protein LOC114758106 [Prosopis alba]
MRIVFQVCDSVVADLVELEKMNTKARTRLYPMKAPVTTGKDFILAIVIYLRRWILTSLALNEKAEMQGSLRKGAANKVEGGKASGTDRITSLQQDIHELKMKLRHEENIHRALERAFNRPLGALPRLPPYLPPCILALLAEVAVLEEEIVRLEEQVVQSRQDLYQEAVYLSSSKRRMDRSANVSNANSVGSPRQVKLKSSSRTIDRQGRENESCTYSFKRSKHFSCNSQTTKIPIKKLSNDNKSGQKCWDPRKRQPEIRVKNKSMAEVGNPGPHEKALGDDSPNIISENILKCLSTILMRMSSVKNPGPAGDMSSLLAPKTHNYVEGWDPYGICLGFGKQATGPYNQLCAIEARSFNPKRAANSLILLCRLKILLRKLASVKLGSLNHQEKLAFWINIYNSCMMNAFIENGIPESPEMGVSLMRKATINVGGHLLSANTIEHFILRLPYHWKFTFLKGAKSHEMTARSIFGLEFSEPLVTFALSCGTWSSPAVRIYTASQVESQLEDAKREYLQAAIYISTSKIAIPKLLDWYLLDFAKDLESLLDWICLQLPSELGKEAIKFIEKRKTQPLSQFVQIIPYDFTFRYLLCT